MHTALTLLVLFLASHASNTNAELSPASCSSECDRRLILLENDMSLVAAGWYRATNGLWYKRLKRQANYYQAKTRCSTLGGRLATVGMRSSSVRSEVLDALVMPGGTRTWIGLDDLAQNRWMWLDGVASTRSNTAWRRGEPNRRDEHCAHIDYDWTIVDNTCTLYMDILCEIRP